MKHHVFVAKEDPCRHRLLEDRPEEADDAEDTHDGLQDSAISLLLFFGAFHLGSRLGIELERCFVGGVEALADEEDEDHHDHEHRSGDECGHEAVVGTDPGHGQGSRTGAEVDGVVEPRERLLQELFVLATVHRSHERADIGLDDARTNGQQTQREVEDVGALRGREAEDRVADDVRHGEEDDGPELAEPLVLDVAAGQAEQVAGGREERSDHAALAVVELHDVGQEERQDGAHAVVGRTFRELAPEDEPEADRMCAQRFQDAHTTPSQFVTQRTLCHTHGKLYKFPAFDFFVK